MINGGARQYRGIRGANLGGPIGGSGGRLKNKALAIISAKALLTLLSFDIIFPNLLMYANIDDSLDSLCKKCQALFTQNTDWALNSGSHNGVDVSHHNITNLGVSAQQGCHLCRIFLDSIYPEQIRRLQNDLASYPEVANCQITASVILNDSELALLDGHDLIFRGAVPEKGLAPQYWSHQSNVARLHLTICPNDNAQAVHRTTCKMTQAEECIVQMKLWLDTCHNHHAVCKVQFEGVSARQMPTRLLEVRGDADNFSIHLVDSKDLKPDTQYLALSHCWGGTLTAKLEAKSLDAYKNSIPNNLLSKTFADAAWLTRKLCFKYIWIDALCTVQDSEDDWLYEASLMADVYKNAVLTIAATASADGNGGLFRCRDPLTISPCKVKPAWETSASRVYYCSNADSWVQKNRRSAIEPSSVGGSRAITIAPDLTLRS